MHNHLQKVTNHNLILSFVSNSVYCFGHLDSHEINPVGNLGIEATCEIGFIDKTNVHDALDEAIVLIIVYFANLWIDPCTAVSDV